MSLPNTFIIGIQKAGTTAFYDWLNQHPEIYGPTYMKDIHFFSLDQYYNQGISFLEKIYKPKNEEKIILSAGVNYFYLPFSQDRIKSFDPNAKLILIFRDPVKRAFSAHNYFYKLGFENLNFHQALKREERETFTDPESIANLTYLDHGKYAEKLSNLFLKFPKEQIKILIYEEMIRNKEETMKEIFNFLEIDPSFKCDFVVSNKTGQPLLRWVNSIFLSESYVKKTLSKIFPYKKIFSIEFRNKIAQKLIKLNTKNGQNRILEEKDYLELRKYFNTDIEKLSLLLNKNLNEIWTYNGPKK